MNPIRFVVHGLVQGVGFRYFVYRHSRRLGLRGFVRNLPDGSVEVVATGAAGSLAELDQLLREGPSHSSVERVEASAFTESISYSDFRIEV